MRCAEDMVTSAWAPATDKTLETRTDQFDVESRGLPGSLLECMKHVNSFLVARDVNDPMFELRVDPDLADSDTDRRHRLAVVRLQPKLEASELKPRDATRIGGKSRDRLPRAPEPNDGLIGRREHTTCCMARQVRIEGARRGVRSEEGGD